MGRSTQTFDILTRLAIGNGSLVYKAVDKASLRQVALKLLTKDTDLDHKFDVDALFEAVPQIRQITGNHVCQLLDAFHDDDGPILVYEFAAGPNGAELPHTKKLTAAQAVDVAAQLISALRSGERQRMPHGDIKASNVLVVDAPEGRPFVFVLDWGLAAFRTESTQDSLPYLAPERLRGEPVSHQADIFAAGVLLFYLLTGKVLAMGQNAEELAQGWAKAKPEVLAELRPDLPAKFVQWVTSLLALDPQKRPASAVDANAALSALNPPPPLAPAESIRPRPLSASQRAMANAAGSGVFAPPQSRVAPPPSSSVTRPVQSGVRPAPQPAAPTPAPVPAVASVPAAVPVATAAPVSAVAVTPVAMAQATVTSTPVRNVSAPAPSKTPVLFVLCLFAAVAGIAGTGVWWFTRKPKVETAENYVPGAPRHRVLEMQGSVPSQTGASIAMAKTTGEEKAKAAAAKSTTPKPAGKPAPGAAKPAPAKTPSKPTVTNNVAAKPPIVVKAPPMEGPLAEEGFAYGAGDAFLSATPSGGWTGSWKATGAQVEAGSLAYDSHRQGGGRVVMAAGSETRSVSRVLGPTTKLTPAGAKEAHWYFATLVQHGDGTPAAGGGVRIYPLDPSGDSKGFQIAIEDLGTNIQISIPGGGAPVTMPDAGKPVFLACRMDWINPKDGKWDFTASLVVNPPMSAKSFAEAGKPIVLSVKGMHPLEESGVMARKGEGAAITRLDEIRYEPHWVDVVFKK